MEANTIVDYFSSKHFKIWSEVILVVRSDKRYTLLDFMIQNLL